MKIIPYVAINLMDLPIAGKKAILLRVTEDDYARIMDAARLVGMLQSQFVRTATVRAADKVLEERGEIV